MDCTLSSQRIFLYYLFVVTGILDFDKNILNFILHSPPILKKKKESCYHREIQASIHEKSWCLGKGSMDFTRRQITVPVSLFSHLLSYLCMVCSHIHARFYSWHHY